MNQCVIYVRVSSQEQAEGYSIDSQLKLLRDYAKKNSMTIVREFRDKESAKRGSTRKGFYEMLELAQINGVKKVLCEKVDRFSRNFKDAQVIEELGIEVHFVKEGEVINSQSSSHKKLMFGFKTLLAKHYLDNLSEETRKGMIEKAEKGELPSKAPIGYVNDPHNRTIKVDSERSPLLKRAFELYVTGDYSLTTLRDKLNREGLTTRTGAKMCKRSVQTILRNHFYYGSFLWSGKLWDGKHEAIISKELFDKVQGKLADKNTSHEKGKEFAFRGLLKCEYCGCLITAEKKKEKYVYYRCSQSRGKCRQRYWREEELDRKFAYALGRFKLNDKTREWAKKALLQSHVEEEEYIKNELARLRAEDTRCETKLHQLYDDKLNDTIDQEFFESAFKQTKKRQQEINTEIERLKQKNQNYMEEGLRILELVQDIKNTYVKAKLEDKAKILKILSSNCTLKGVSVTFHWNKPFDILFKLGQSKEKGERGVSNPQPLDPQSSALTS